MHRSKFVFLFAGLLTAATYGCDTRKDAPGVTEEEPGARGEGASPGLGSGTESSGAPEWMQGDDNTPREKGAE